MIVFVRVRVTKRSANEIQILVYILSAVAHRSRVAPLNVEFRELQPQSNLLYQVGGIIKPHRDTRDTLLDLLSDGNATYHNEQGSSGLPSLTPSWAVRGG